MSFEPFESSKSSPEVAASLAGAGRGGPRDGFKVWGWLTSGAGKLKQGARQELHKTLEQAFEQWLAHLRQAGDLPLTLRLWNGREVMFCDPQHVKVNVSVRTQAALPYLIEPSLSNLGQAYVEGLIDVAGELRDVVAMAHGLAERSLKPEGLWGRVAHRYAHARRDDKSAITHHYDISNEFYQLWLDAEMVYSCAYFENGTETLAQAQLKKLDHILTKVQAGPNDRLLDIGCGWGALVIRAAQEYGCRCTGITLSEQQLTYARARVKALGLDDRIEIRLQDYRDVEGEFERITSVGMFEHVGVGNLPTYFDTIGRLLSDQGMAVNHGITSTDPLDGQTAFGGGDFIAKYVFPGGELAHLGSVLKALQGGGLETLDVESLRRHYAQTLRCWSETFEAKSGQVRDLVGEQKFRIWRIYLLGCSYAFEHDEISLFQIVCRKAGRPAAELGWSRRYMYS
jgi:cyclopropane-fatty-acyl-phospholipid synthase